MNILKISLMIIFFQVSNSYFIRSNKVYEEVVKGLCNYYDVDSVFIFYSSENHVNNADIKTALRLKNLFTSLNSYPLFITITSIEKFIQVYDYKLQKIFLVFLNDSWDLRIQLIEKLAPLINMSNAIWLIYFQPDTDIDHYFDGLNIPFDCRFMISQTNTSDNSSEIITELYRVWKDKELRYNIFGSWDLTTGMKLPTKTLYRRRNSLHGHTIRISTANWKPLTAITIDENNKTKIEGSTGQIMDILQETMNFTSTYLVTQGFGSPTKNGTWSDSTGDLITSRADIACLAFQMTRERLDVIDFTVPLFITRGYFFFKKPPPIIKWHAFLSPFSRNTWISILFVIIITSTLINLIGKFYLKNFPQDIKYEKHLHILNIFLHIFGAFCSQGIPRSSITSVAFIQFTVHLTCVVIYAAYSGLLISSLTVDTTLTYTKSLNDILNEDSRIIGAVKDIGLHSIINNTEDPLLKAIHRKRFLSRNLLPLDNFEALDRLCNGSMIFLSTNLYVFNLKPDDCILRASEVAFKFSNAFGFPKNSPFREFFNQQITSLHDYGVLQKLLGQYVKIKSITEKSRYESVKINSVLTLFVFLGMNYFISLLILYYERHHHVRRPRI